MGFILRCIGCAVELSLLSAGRSSTGPYEYAVPGGHGLIDNSSCPSPSFVGARRCLARLGSGIMPAGTFWRLSRLCSQRRIYKGASARCANGWRYFSCWHYLPAVPPRCHHRLNCPVSKLPKRMRLTPIISLGLTCIRSYLSQGRTFCFHR